MNYDADEQALINKLQAVFRAPNPKVKKLVALFVDALYDQYPGIQEQELPSNKPKNKTSKSKSLHR